MQSWKHPIQSGHLGVHRTKEKNKMNISKLTLTPITSQGSKLIIKNPTQQTAITLINDRLASSCEIFEKRKPIYKMPKFLKGLANPATYVGPANKLK